MKSFQNISDYQLLRFAWYAAIQEQQLFNAKLKEKPNSDFYKSHVDKLQLAIEEIRERLIEIEEALKC